MESSHAHVPASAADELSALPDDILVGIAERLDLRAAIRLAAASRHWRRVQRLLPFLKIDVYDLMVARDLDTTLAVHAATARWLLAPATRPPALRRLYLGFYLKDPYLRSLGRAVEDAVAGDNGDIEHLEFTIRTTTTDEVSNNTGDDEEQAGAVVLGELFMSFFDACPIAFNCLSSLDLENVRFSESAVPTLMGACRNLRYLPFKYCDSGPASTLKIDAPLSKLQTLKLESCGYRTVELVNVPKLEELHFYTWCGDNLPTSFGRVPCLRLISFSSPCLDWQEPFALGQWLPNSTNISNLSLDFCDEKIWVKPESPRQLSHAFSNLRIVSLYNISHDCDLNWTIFVLEAAPSLTKFLVKVSWHTCGRNKCEDSAEKAIVSWEPSKFKHNNLSLLQVEGFAVEKKVMRYIRLVIKCAVSLKRIRLLKPDPREMCDSRYCRHHSSMRHRFPVQEKEKNTIRKRLKDGLSTSAEINIY
ncbi:unnamed protein product [Urochloa decumbens]|uniref:F-box domain-containing protein n=1 Tax=Urochloa decumbens TaxID=240449 RepID=A0ABC8ZML3_9POAL